MPKRKLKQESQRSVSARFPYSDYAEIFEQAEEKGINIAEMLRITWRYYREQQQLADVLSKMEARLTRKIFDICSATSGLSDDERNEAILELKERSVRREP